jgi:deoxyribonuclease V
MEKTMQLAIDVYYYESKAKAVGVLFEWPAEKPNEIISVWCDDIAAYEPGHFYKRELPCILDLLAKIDLNRVASILVDGHVYVNNDGTYGLGGHLFEALEGKTPIIGVAKRAFHQTEDKVTPVLRGKSQTPLYVSAIGCDVQIAAENIKEMHGDFRFPTLLKILDQETRKNSA